MFRTFLAALALIIGCASAQATTLTLDFNANSTFNPGSPGAGLTTGQIVLNSEGSTSQGAGLQLDVFASINFTVNGLLVQSNGTPTTDRLFQVDINGGGDGLLGTYSGGFAPTGGAFEIQSVAFDIRFTQNGLIFRSIDDLFGAVSDGQQFTLADLDFISLTVSYVGQSAGDVTILRFNDVPGGNDTVSNGYVPDSMTITVAAVPLPGGLALLFAGLGGLAVMRRRSD